MLGKQERDVQDAVIDFHEGSKVKNGYENMILDLLFALFVPEMITALKPTTA